MRFSTGIKFLTFILDLIGLTTGLALALYLRYPETFGSSLFQLHAGAFTVVHVGWLVIMYITNLYDKKFFLNRWLLIVKLAQALSLGIVLGVIVFYLLPNNDLTPKRLLLLDGALGFGLIVGLRALLISLIGKYFQPDNILLLGNGPMLSAIVNETGNKTFRIVGVISDHQSEIAKIDGIKLFGDWNRLPEIVEKNRVNKIVLVNDLKEANGMTELLYPLLSKVEFLSAEDFYEETFHKIPVSEIDATWMLTNLKEPSKVFEDGLKRIADILLGLILLAITIVTFPVVAILVWTTKGPLFFTQRRVGLNGKPFVMVKYRTMYGDVDDKKVEWLTNENDPKITWAGKFLRKSRLNELPQAWNIIKGEMSFVGPRPERPEFVKMLEKEIPFYNDRHLAKPGLTGWAQIHYGYVASVKESVIKLQYDLYYVKHRNLFMDLGIILKTVANILGLKGR